MMSFLTTTHETLTLTPIPPHIPITQVLTLLHDHEKMITMNPLVTVHTLLPPTHILAKDFFKFEPIELQPSTRCPCEIWEITDDLSANTEGETGSGWRGGWSKRFIPDQITYTSSLQDREDGLVSITHAPMGVHSVTTWIVREAGPGESSLMLGDGRLVLEEKGVVRASRMLMGFIKTTLQESHEKLVKDFMGVLEGKGRNGQEVGNELKGEL
ncbi:619b9e6c-33b3-4b0c-8a40-841fdb9fe021 [Sclerotinia trifoliorum]|uniref:619b9e6c-33b3-4b0c-8a40-841fdb9fe021 n=1 Tax=Sclerotinia trifoliorum TaxID=28548 RepID=A0A8H2VT69_9HELO|nr:619b9e6c-33b3-4b0c-8a40-841fdb9fe021 [Sclerotinia trifoliorum]